MFNDKVSKYLDKRGKLPTKVIQKEHKLPPQQDPVNSERIAFRRKAALFNHQANLLRQQASIQESHRVAQQLIREAEVAQSIADENAEKADSIKHSGIDGMKSWVTIGTINRDIIKAEVKTKREEGVDWAARYFLDVPDPERSSTWGLRTHEVVEGQKKMTKQQLGRAAAALGPKGFMGNQYKEKPNGKSKSELKRALLSKYRQLGVSDEDIPSYILSVAHMSEDEDEEPIIEHYGRKGMKWGQKIFSKKVKDSAKKTAGYKAAKKKLGKMSNEELESHIKRMRLEKQYAELSSSKKSMSKTERGKQEVGKAIAKGTKTAIENVTAQQMQQALNYAIKSAKNRNRTPRGG